MPATTKGAWKLQEVRDAVLAGEWVTYDTTNDTGTLWGWGCGIYGMFADNTFINRSSPIQIPGTIWVKHCGGRYHNLARKSDCTLWTWGNGAFGKMGDNTAGPKSSPVQIPGTSWSQIAVGSNHSMGIKTDCTLWGWGYNGPGNGALGINTSIPRSSPTQVPGYWSKVTGGTYSTFAFRTDNTLWAWGNNAYGRLGQNNLIDRASPVQIPGNNWNNICTQWFHVLGTKSDGTLWAWGQNNYGKLGDNTLIHRSSPVQIPGTNWNDVSSSRYFSLARKTDGTLWAWGKGAYLGNDTVIHRSSPVQIPGTSWNDISSGRYVSLARKTDGSLWAWGRNDISGVAGDGTIISRSSPVQIPGTSWVDISNSCSASFARKSYTPFFYDIIGTHLWSWGCGNDIGDNSFIGKCSPVQLLGYQWSAIGKGCVHTAAVKNDGTLWVWGSNSSGDSTGILGLNDAISRCSPTQIPGTSWCDVTSHLRGSHAIKTDGTLWGWGQNCLVGGSLGTGAAGVVGDNTEINRSSPVQIPGTSWCKVRAGTRHVMGLKTDGTLWGWGNNYRGPLGVGNLVHRCSPTQVPGNNWCDVSATYVTTHALKTDGSLWAWGFGTFGELGVANNTGPFASPVQIPGSWSKISMGGPDSRANLALKSDGTLWSWGNNNDGNVGDNSVIPRSSPVQIPGNSWCEADVGARSSFAVKTDGTLWAWGWNGNYGLFLGLNDLIHRSSPTQIPGTGWVKAFGGVRSSMAFKCYTG